MACKVTRLTIAGHSWKRAVFSLLACGMLFMLAGCAAGNTDTLEAFYKEEASARIFNGASGYDDNYMAKGADAPESVEYIEKSLDSMDSIESMESIVSIGTVESPIVDKWPESIACVSNGMTAQPFSVSISIDEPMELSVSCIREEGIVGMRITDVAGNIYFDEKKMQTEDYTVTIDEAGVYTVAFYAKAWYGKITIKPSK